MDNLESLSAYLFMIICGGSSSPWDFLGKKQEYWSELPFLWLADLPDPRIELGSPATPALSGRAWEPREEGRTPTDELVK